VRVRESHPTRGKELGFRAPRREPVLIFRCANPHTKECRKTQTKRCRDEWLLFGR
jgi:hypothetical protein